MKKTLDENGNLLLLNTYNGHLLKIPRSNKDMYEKILKNPNSVHSNKQIHDYLMDKEFLINSHVDEERRVEVMYLETVRSQEFLHLVILPTEDCNFRCEYCYESYNNGKMKPEIIRSIKLYVTNELKKYQKLRVEWFGGEPLEALDIIEDLSEHFIKVCKEQGKPYFASITTNGYNLTNDVIKKLIKLHILRYQITLDGPQDVHDKQRIHQNNSGTYEQILTNLRNIRDKEKNRMFYITIRTNISKSVKERIEEHIDVLSNEFSHDKRFGVIMKVIWDNEKGETDFNKIELLDTGDLHEVLTLCKDKGLQFGLNRGQIANKGSVCFAAFANSLVIGSDGRLYKCTVSYDKDINKIGWLLSNGKADIDKEKWAFWTSRKPQKGTYDKCLKCNFQPACLGISCPLNAFDENGNHVCSGMKNYLNDYMILCSENEGLYTEVGDFIEH